MRTPGAGQAAFFAGIALVIVGAILLFGRRAGTFVRDEGPDAETAAAPSAFTLCTTRRAPAARAPDPVWSEALLASALRALPEHDRTSLESALVRSTMLWETRVNPMLDDLEDHDPDEPMSDWLTDAPSLVTAARAATRREVCAGDGWCVRAEGRRHLCEPPWSAPGTEAELERARFLLWSYGHALVMVAQSETDARRAARELRERLPEARRMGLVLAPDDRAAAAEPPLAPIRRLWLRLAVLKQGFAAEHSASAALSPGDADAGDSSLLALEPREVLVLPRLEAVADPGGLEREVKAIAPSLVRAATSRR